MLEKVAYPAKRAPVQIIYGTKIFRDIPKAVLNTVKRLNAFLPLSGTPSLDVPVSIHVVLTEDTKKFVESI